MVRADGDVMDCFKGTHIIIAEYLNMERMREMKTQRNVVDNKSIFMKPRIIAFYLPQYYPFKENNEWWGEGFTEWTNVGKAKPLFKGHYQPRVPANLGYYDLRIPEVREKQAELAREAGIEGFCYWHYWFGNGKRLMTRVFDEVLETQKPNFPFCLGWANHSWYAKTWDNDGQKDKLLIEQKYFGVQDYKLHFNYALKAFKDKRYIMDGNRPIFYVFRPLDVPNEFFDVWNELASDNGFKDGVAFVGQCRTNIENAEEILNKGCNYVMMDRIGEYYNHYSFMRKLKQHLKSILRNEPLQSFDYSDFIQFMTSIEDTKLQYIPQIMCNWDHSPRSGRKGLILNNATPQAFRKHVYTVLDIVKNKPEEKRFIFLKSWNEWGEGNYMEPDLRYGKGYIEELAKVLNNTL